MIRLACCADIHLDDKATAAGRLVLGADGHNVRAVDRDRCLEAFVDGAIAQACHLAVIAGDLFERPKPTPTEYCAAERALDRLCGAMPVALCGDNHGLPQSPLEQHAIAPLAGRHPGLTVFLRPDVQTICTMEGDIQIAALPWPQRSILAAKEDLAGLGPEAINDLVAEKLAAIVRAMLASRQPDIPLILVGHVMLREAIFDNGQGPDTGAITLSAQDLAGFDLAVLGDIHRAQAFGDGRIFYTGSLDRTDFGEEHQEKSWTCVELAAGEPLRLAQFPTPARRYLTYSPEELERMPFDPDVICRVNGKISQEDYDSMQPVLAYWRNNPLFVEEIEIARQTRARSEDMRSELSAEAALNVWARTQGKEAELPALLEAHREIAGGTK